MLYVVTIYTLFKCYSYDLIRYLRNSGMYSLKETKGEIESELLFQIHRLEKGLSLVNTRPCFGIDSISNIIRMLDKYKLCYKNDYKYKSSFVFKYAMSIFKEYDRFHNNIGEEHGFRDVKEFNEYKHYSDLPESGAQIVDYSFEADMSFKSVVQERFSCRHYTNSPVVISDLHKAIGLATNTPSVCNRQHWRVRHFKNQEAHDILSHQNGNASFNESINEILLVTSDLAFFRSPFERNQAFVDGGMFSMNLINALYFYNIASCPLNWASSLEQNKFINKSGYIGETEVVMMVISIGNYPDSVKKTLSSKGQLENFLLT